MYNNFMIGFVTNLYLIYKKIKCNKIVQFILPIAPLESDIHSSFYLQLQVLYNQSPPCFDIVQQFIAPSLNDVNKIAKLQVPFEAHKDWNKFSNLQTMLSLDNVSSRLVQ